MLIDLSDEPISGKEAEEALGRAGITVNKNTVPKERRSAMVTSGVRIGTPAITTRGMGVDECKWIASKIIEVLRNPTDEERLSAIALSVKELCSKFPMYSGYSL
jgi:glycine hydroxymethyltransferase